VSGSIALVLTPSLAFLLFDFDGTIADTRTLALSILNELSEEFKFRFLPEEVGACLAPV
jgi:beta-phosphoglucomutase-like phosphatase (HAD superfamily)